MVPPSLSALAALSVRIGNLTFGGGDPTMAAFHQEFVVRRKWLSHEQYGLFFGLARVTPGTNLLAFCAAVGWRLLGWPGAILAVAAVTLPSAALVVWLTFVYGEVRSNPWAIAAIGGTLAAAVGLMAAGAWQIVSPHLKRGTWLRALVIAGGAVLLARAFSLRPIAILALAALVGLVWRDPATKP
jgi:chromate transporter